MPDLITHVCTGYFVSRPKLIRRYLVIFYLGTILPDFLSRPFSIIFPGSFWFFVPFHSIFVQFLACWLISIFFEKRREAIFIVLLSGTYFHLLLDFCQKHITGGYLWFFPFSWKSFELGLFWPEDSLYVVPVLVVGVVIAEILRRKPLSGKTQ